MPKLIVQIPDGEEVAYEFDDPVVTIGRGSGNSIVIPHGSLSGEHARLSRNPDGSYTLADAGSTNGTFVNGDHVTEVVLPSYAGLVFGQVACAYYGTPEAETAPVGAARSAFQLPDLAEKGRPANFLPVSPFPRKRTDKNPIGAVATLLGVLSLLVSAGVVGAVFVLLRS
jgi:hypothetical protein